MYCNRCYLDKFVDEDTKAEGTPLSLSLSPLPSLSTLFISLIFFLCFINFIYFILFYFVDLLIYLFVVAHLENAYARKQTHMTAKAILPTPGGAKGYSSPLPFLLLFSFTIISMINFLLFLFFLLPE